MCPQIYGFDDRFKEYLSTCSKNDVKTNKNAKILDAAGFCATVWEWHRIEQPNRGDYEIPQIKKRFRKKWRDIDDLQGISPYGRAETPYQAETPYDQIKGFVDLCGSLRFQERWSHLYRVPRTSVLGHMLIVAILSYLFSLKIEETFKTENTLKTRICTKRRFNNFFGGLFHDLPEALTRDIISPVKERTGEELIKEFEKKEMNKRIFDPVLIPKECFKEMHRFTENEFQSKVAINNISETKTSKEITEKYYEDEFDPFDGEIIQAADHLAAFLEAYLAIQNGIVTSEFNRVVCMFKEKYEDCTNAGLRFGEIYADF